MKVAALEGGWEGWTQVEIGVICLDMDVKCKREQACFKDSNYSKADFVFTGHDPLTIMELKCKITSDTAQTFAEKLLIDAAKFRKLSSELKDTNLVVGVVGLYPPKFHDGVYVHDVETMKAVDTALKAQKHTMIVNEQIVDFVFNHTVSDDYKIGVWWWWKSIPRAEP